MLPHLLALAFVIAPALAPQGENPRAIVQMATRAVQGDTAEKLTARWQARLSRDAGDRASMLGLATLARLRYDYPTAQRLYDGLVARASDGYVAYAHLGLAEGFEARSIAREALKEFALALATSRNAGDRVAEGETFLWLAFARGRLEGVKVAQALLDSASVLIPASATDLQARLRSRSAVVSALYGRAAEASTRADSAVLLARQARDPRIEADAYRVVGQVLQYRGQWDSALVALHKSEELYRQAHNRSALGTSLIWHAQVLGSLLRFGEMRDVAQRGIAEGEATHNPAAVAEGHRALGVLSEMLGDWPTAAAHLKTSLAISGASDDSSGMRMTAKYLVKVAFAAGDVATAKRLTRDWYARAVREDDANEMYEADRELADIATRQGDAAAAAQALADARKLLPRLPGGDYIGWLLHDEARHALARNDLPAAERLLGEYLNATTKGKCVLCRFDARMRRADVYARRGELARAETELVSATNDLEEWRHRLKDSQLRTMAFQTSITIDEAGAEPNAGPARTARVLAALAAGGRVDAAFSLSERWRARELTDRLVRAAALRSSDKLTAAYGRLTSASPSTAAEIAAGLPDEHTALVEYVAAAGAPVTVFVVQRSGVRARVVPASDSLSESVARFGTLLESGVSAQRLGRALGTTYVDPVIMMLDRGVTRLVIVPDGPLHRLPFDALRLADGRYLIQAYGVGYAPSASAVVALERQRPLVQQASQPRMLAFGNPSLASGRRTTRRDVARDVADDDDESMLERVRTLPALAGAAREARLVGRYSAAADVRIGEGATASFLKRTDLRSYRVLHFAAHALVDERSVTRTALALSPGDGETGIIGVGDLAGLELDADLVVLSACRSAGGVIVGGEGVQGLTSPLLQAGARSVVATLWRIPDQGVVPFVEAFYDALARGLPVSDALRAAKLGAIDSGESPRTWAAFLAIGDPMVRVTLRTPAPKPWWWSVLPP